MLSPSAIRRRRPRIGVDLHTLDDIDEGGQNPLLGLYRKAVQLAPDIDFILLVGEPEALRHAYPEFDTPNVRAVRMRPMHAAVRIGAQLSWHQVRQRLDLLHVRYSLPFVSLGACACTIPDVLFATHPQFFSGPSVLISKMTSRSAVSHSDLLFTVSRHSRQALAETYRIDPATITITYNAVDSERFHPYPVADDLCARYGLVPQGYLCAIGPIEPRKNHQTLIRAYAALAPSLRSHPLVIIGRRSTDFAATHQLTESLGVGQSVRFLDDLDDTDLPVLLSQAALFIHPSWAEGFGMPVLEALACGVPVITSSTTATAEVAGQAARLVDPADVNALSQAITADLTMSAGERSLRIADGLKQAALFDWQRSARVLVDHLRQFLTGETVVG